MKKINEKQINLLFEFTRKHFVEYYDVQVELVDHLANGIEEQWKTHSERSFEEALNLEFKKFGIFGFTDLVEKKQGELNKYYYQLIWKELKTFFNLPKIILTAGLLFFFYQLYFFIGVYTQEAYIAYTFFMMALLVCCLVDNTLFQRKLKKIEKDKKWLITSVSYLVSWVPLTIGFYFSNAVFGIFQNNVVFTQTGLIITVIISTVNSLLYIIITTKIKPLLIEEVKQMQMRFS